MWIQQDFDHDWLCSSCLVWPWREQFGGPQNVRAKLPLKLVVCWVDESGKELSAKRAQNVTNKWLAAETGFSEEIAER